MAAPSSPSPASQSTPGSLRARVQALGTMQRRQLYSDSLNEADLRWWSNTLRETLSTRPALAPAPLVRVTRRDLATFCSDEHGRSPLALDAIVAELVAHKELLDVSELEALRRVTNEAAPSLLTRLVSWIMPSASSSSSSSTTSSSSSSSPSTERVYIVRRVLESLCDEIERWCDEQVDGSSLVMTLTSLRDLFPMAEVALPWLQSKRQRAYVWRAKDGTLCVTLRPRASSSQPLPLATDTSVFEHDSAVLRLSALLVTLSHRVRALEQRIRDGTARAVELHKAGDKARAVAQLRSVRSVRSALKQCEDQGHQLELALEHVMASAINQPLLEALRGASQALRSVQVKGEDVDTVMDELQEALQENGEVAEALRDHSEALLPPEALDEEGLERELRALVAEESAEAKGAEDAKLKELMDELHALEIGPNPKDKVTPTSEATPPDRNAEKQ